MAEFPSKGTRDRLEKGWVALLSRFEIAVVVFSVAVGIAAAIGGSVIAEHDVKADFYAVIAQVLPVFLVALVVEQRLVDRLGMSEDEYAKRAEHSAGLAVEAQIAYESEEAERGRQVENLFDSQPEFAWVGRHAMDMVFPDAIGGEPDIEGMARTRYRQRRRNEAVFVIATVALLVLGEGTALAGLITDGTSRCSGLFWVAVASTTATFLAITLGGMKELRSSLR